MNQIFGKCANGTSSEVLLNAARQQEISRFSVSQPFRCTTFSTFETFSKVQHFKPIFSSTENRFNSDPIQCKQTNSTIFLFDNCIFPIQSFPLKLRNEWTFVDITYSHTFLFALGIWRTFFIHIMNAYERYQTIFHCSLPLHAFSYVRKWIFSFRIQSLCSVFFRSFYVRTFCYKQKHEFLPSLGIECCWCLLYGKCEGGERRRRKWKETFECFFSAVLKSFICSHSPCQNITYVIRSVYLPMITMCRISTTMPNMRSLDDLPRG